MKNNTPARRNFETRTRCIAMTLSLLLCLLAQPAAMRAATTNAASAPYAVPRESVKPFQPPVLIAGSARERGRAYGKIFRDGIHEFLNKEVYQAFIGKPASKEELLQYAADCAVVTREVCPVIAEEIAGIAEGAGLEFNEVMLVQLHEEIYHRATLPTKHGHCTAVAIAPKDSGDKHAYLGQTWDWMTSVAGKSQITEWRRGRDGADVLAYGFPGLPMGAGMNSRGIAFCWTSAALKQKGQSPRVGLPSYALIAHLLNQKSVEDIIREAKRDKHAGWFTFVFNDAKGNIVNLEGSPTGMVIARSSQHMVRADYGTTEKRDELKETVKGWMPPPRCEKLNTLLEASAGKNNRATIQDYLQDTKYSIATAGNPRNVSIDVMLFDSTAKKAYFTRGPEYGIEWREFGFGTGKK